MTSSRNRNTRDRSSSPPPAIGTAITVVVDRLTVNEVRQIVALFDRMCDVSVRECARSAANTLSGLEYCLQHLPEHARRDAMQYAEDVVFELWNDIRRRQKAWRQPSQQEAPAAPLRLVASEGGAR